MTQGSDLDRHRQYQGWAVPGGSYRITLTKKIVWWVTERTARPASWTPPGLRGARASCEKLAVHHRAAMTVACPPLRLR